jgi:dTDP-4-dehydrorhamnose reductase
MKILILGASGMAGHTISIYFLEKGHEVYTFTRKPFFLGKNINGDVNDRSLLSDVIMKNNFDAIINCVGILNQFAEENKHEAVYVNSFLPHFLTDLAKNSKTRIVQMSTDCVFSGLTGNYDESSFKDGETFYDRTKALGEIVNDKDITFRNSIIGPDINKEGIGLFNWFMKQNTTIHGYSNVIWTGVSTLTLAKAIEKALLDNLTGLYNLVNNEKISKFRLLELFNKHMKNNSVIILPDDTLKLDKSLVNNRKDFSFVIPTYEEMVSEMKTWIENHMEIYPHYISKRGV